MDQVHRQILLNQLAIMCALESLGAPWASSAPGETRELLSQKNEKGKGKQLSLYVWTNFCPDYRGGLAFALAESVAHAKQLIEAERGVGVSDWGEFHVYADFSKPRAFCVSGGS